MVHGDASRVVERRSATAVDLLERVLHHGQIAREVLVQVGFVVEVDDEHLVLRIGGLHEFQCRRVDLAAPFPHAAGIVDHQADRDRHVLLREVG